jgi:GntR family transcriptional repressor for pyruvate dehydrogenase complex
LKEMQKILTPQEAKASENSPITDEDTLFHEEIAKSTGNSILIKLVQSLNHYLRASRQQSLVAPGGNQRSISDHKEIVAAIAAKNPQAAYHAMIKHLANVERLISQTLKRTKADSAWELRRGHKRVQP